MRVNIQLDTGNKEKLEKIKEFLNNSWEVKYGEITPWTDQLVLEYLVNKAIKKYPLKEMEMYRMISKEKLKEHDNLTFGDIPVGKAFMTDQWDMYADAIVWYRLGDDVYFLCVNYAGDHLVPVEDDALSVIQLNHEYTAAYHENEDELKTVVIPDGMTMKEYYNKHYLETYMTGNIVGEEVPVEQAREIIPVMLVTVL